MTARFGATPEEWQHLSLLLGLTADLLPVVSNPVAVISPESKMRQLGKTPSKYNFAGQVSGIANWTQRQSTPEEVSAWRDQPDYGICVQTRHVRAIDVDVPDHDLAAKLHVEFAHLGLPVRARRDSGKFLRAFILEGDYTKRSFKTNGGIVEFLATGQQFIACGTHPSGARYEWMGGLPDEFPTITPEQFEYLWASLVRNFAIEAPNERKATTKAATLAAASSSDPVAQRLYGTDRVLSTEGDGRLHIICPFAGDHTTESAESATTYFPAHTGGYARGHFRCLHAHCEHRTDAEFQNAVGYSESIEDFGVVPATDANVVGRFTVIPEHEFTQGRPPAWIVKGVLPEAQLVVVFGESGSGKSFIMLDLLAAIAQGTPWRGHAVKQGRGVYVAAEGAAGFKKRLTAYKQHHDVDRLDVGVIADAPDLMKVDDVRALIASITAFGPVSVIVVDTFAQAMPGANENSGEDVGKALSHCKALSAHTGALVVLIHHSGKDSTRGARGWSGLRAAADAEVEITRCDHERVATITKQKDGEDGEEFGFKLHTVIVGQDEEGETISSCVVEHTAVASRASRKKPVKGDNEKIVLRVLDSLIELDGSGPDFHSLVVAACGQLVPPEEGKRDRRGEVVKRAIENLVAGGHIAQVEGQIARLGDG